MDRSQFKATTITSSAKSGSTNTQKEKVDDPTRAKYINLENGKNKIRLYPFHPKGGGNSFMEEKAGYFLPTEEGKKKFIFDAIIHGGYKRDIVREYLKFAEELLRSNGEEDRVAELVDWKTGLKLNRKFVVYADKMLVDGTKEFGLLELGQAIKYRLNEIASVEDSGSPITTDPFTDVEMGRAIIITKRDEERDPKKKISVDMDSSFDRATGKLTFYPLSDSELNTLLEKRSLYSLFRNVYRKRDFELAVAGLKVYDTINNIGAFEYDNWLETVESISNELRDEEVTETVSAPVQTTKPSFSAPVQEVSAPVSKKSTDMFDNMTRQELKLFIMENELEIVVKNTMNDEDLKDRVRLAVSLSQESEEVSNTVEEEETIVEKPEPKESRLATLERLRKTVSK